MINDEEEVIAIDNMDMVPFLKGKLRRSLQDALGGSQISNEVQVLFLRELKRKTNRKPC